MENKIISKKDFSKLLLALGILGILAAALFSLSSFPPLAYWLSFWYVFFVAVSICISVCLVGIEGALLFVPFFAVLFPMLSGKSLTLVEAIRVGLFTEIFGFTSSFFGFWRAGLIDFKMARFTLYIAVPAAILGGVLLYLIPVQIVIVIIAVWLLFMAFLLWKVPQEHIETDLPKIGNYQVVSGPEDNHELITRIDTEGNRYIYKKPPLAERGIVASIGGLFTGMLGFGIGILGLSHLVFRQIPIRIAAGTSHLVILWVALTAAIPHFIKVFNEGFVQSMPWNILIMTVPAVSVGGQIAPWLAGRLPQNKIEKFLISLLIILSFILFYRAIKAF